jgi:hypothetical protein
VPDRAPPGTDPEASYVGEALRGPATPIVRSAARVDDPATARLVLDGIPSPPSTTGARQAYGSTWYPGTPAFVSATSVDLDAGATRSGIDIRMRPVRVQRVAGRVEGVTGSVSGLLLRLIPEGDPDVGFGSEAATTLTDRDGTFVFLDVSAGAYVLKVAPFVTDHSLEWRGGGGETSGELPGFVAGSFNNLVGLSGPPGSRFRTWAGRQSAGVWVREPITVGTDPIDDLLVRLRPTVRIAGRIVADPSSTGPNDLLARAGRFGIRAESFGGGQDLGLMTGRMSPDRPGDFAIEDVLPGRYFLRPVLAPPGWTLLSVVVDGRDQTYRPLTVGDVGVADVTITFTDKVAGLGGAVTPRQDIGFERLIVIAFPHEPEQRRDYGLAPLRFATVHPNAEGRFTLTTLPAGEYLVAAVDSAYQHAWRDPALLESLAPQATRVTLRWGEGQQVTLTPLEVGGGR